MRVSRRVGGTVVIRDRLTAGLHVTTPLRFGVITDTQYSVNADNVEQDVYYSDGLAKLTAAQADFDSAGVDFTIHVGDMTDERNVTEEQQLTAAAEIEAVASLAPRYYTIGNHDLAGLSTAQIVTAFGMEAAYYAFRSGGITFVVLDSSTGTVPSAQVAWLAQELREATLAVVVCHHEIHDSEFSAAATNATELRSVIEAAGNVALVCTAHAHRNVSATVNGVRYVGVEAACRDPSPGNAYAVVTLTGPRVVVEGFGNQSSYA